MKFSKYLVNACVPEWRPAYVDYKGLKRYIKDMPFPTDDIFIRKLQLELAKIGAFYNGQRDTLPPRLAYIEKRLSLELLPPTNNGQQQKDIKYTRFLLRELYRFCTFLLNFQKLNRIAFIKILKKYDKKWDTDLRNRLADAFLDDNTFLDDAPKQHVVKVEQHLTSLFAYVAIHYPQNLLKGTVKKNASSRTMAMQYLRGKGKVKDEFAFFRVGMFLGISLMLIIFTIMSMIHGVPPMQHAAWKSVLYMFGGMFTIVLSFFLFACDLMLWNKYRINHVFILEINVSNALTWKQFFEFAAISLFLWSLCVYLTVHEVLVAWMQFYYVPLLLLGLYVVLLLMPFPVLYEHSRWWFVKTLYRIMTPGFHQVTFKDFFVADLCTSLTFFWSALYLTGCFYISGGGPVDICSPKQSWVTPFLISIPLTVRLVQCCRKYYDMRMKKDVVNAGKYVCALVAVFASSWAVIAGNTFALIMWLGIGVFSAMYSFYWDIAQDWKVNSRNASIPHILPKRTLHVAVVVDFFLRFNWILTISTIIIFDKVLLAFVFGVLEIFRRYIWALFRMELEHTHNVENYRAIKDIPLLNTSEDEV